MMRLVRRLAKKAKQDASLLCYSMTRQCGAKESEGVPEKEIFTHIFEGNLFGGADSVSGPGSDLKQTEILVREFPEPFRAMDVATLLAIPCGDFHWMKTVDMQGVDYLGADIVDSLMEQNNRAYGTKGVRFETLNLMSGRLPSVDLILCRDCLVHFSFRDVFAALHNMCSSGSTYLLTTTFPWKDENGDIVTGDWRPVNLQVAPFCFPDPICVIREGCTGGQGGYKDKSLGLWRIEVVQNRLKSGVSKMVQKLV